jgi:hypothetical protein
MVRDITSDVQACLSVELKAAVDALTVLNKLFFRQETQSAALGEVSESLIAIYTGAIRTKRNTKGYDLRKEGLLIEVKSRLIDRYNDDCQFNFRKHTALADTAYCLGWRIDDKGRPWLPHVFEVGVSYLKDAWAKPKQPTYCARTTLGKLKAAALMHAHALAPG